MYTKSRVSIQKPLLILLRLFTTSEKDLSHFHGLFKIFFLNKYNNEIK